MKFQILSIVILSSLCSAHASERVMTKQNLETGALSEIRIEGDSTQMNWMLSPDGSQYPWVTDQYGWGLGYFTLSSKHNTSQQRWYIPESVGRYKCEEIAIEVDRQQLEDGSLRETYKFTNEGNRVAALQDIGIFTPFNDNYPDSRTCITYRANAHIWAEGDFGWVNATRMGAAAPHLGLLVTGGSLAGYEIHQRGRDKANSQYRGVIALNLPDLWLSPGESSTLSWVLFPHQGNDDFRKQIISRGGVMVDADKYVLQVGDTVKVRATAQENVKAKVNGLAAKVFKDENGSYVEVFGEHPGEVKVEFDIEGKIAPAELLVISSEEGLIDNRLAFIRDRQQMKNPADPRDGAYMIFDIEGDSIYLNDTPNANPVDRDEGAERVGMGVAMAKKYRLTKDEKIGESVKRYARFVREKLQTPDYVTYSSVDHKQRNRGYNYMWVADLYFQLYMATGEKQYAVDGYETLQAMFRQFGYGFYAIDIPVTVGLEALEKAGMKKERKRLLQDFEKVGTAMVANGLDYPKFEVNYEQSIVAPAIEFLTQLYMATGKQKYLDEVERQLPVLEAFNGSQPSFHLNDVGIRHWDGYWFGKRELFGDTMPHYWSTITAAAFHNYAKITGKEEYQRRAENIVRNNLCLFFEDGTASCAFLYPNKIDGAKAHFYDPYANDQDWAISYYFLVNNDI